MLTGCSLHIGYDPTPEGLHHAAYLFKVGAGFGFLTVILGWSISILVALQAASVPVLLPKLSTDLLTNLLPRRSKPIVAEQDPASRV